MSQLPESERRRRRVLEAKSAEERNRIYDEWAALYDADIRDDLGFAGPERAASIFSKHVPRRARILDAGAGTGLVGEALWRCGYRDLHALDASEAMLAQAQAKQIYRSHIEALLGSRVALNSNDFDAVVSVGTLTSGHVEPQVLSELVRVVRPCGHVVFTLVPEFGRRLGYYDEMHRLECCGAWRKVDESDTFAAFNEHADYGDYRVWVYAVC